MFLYSSEGNREIFWQLQMHDLKAMGLSDLTIQFYIVYFYFKQVEPMKRKQDKFMEFSPS
jgi:hypothetical protein